jgi:hypothetical protein
VLRSGRADARSGARAAGFSRSVPLVVLRRLVSEARESRHAVRLGPEADRPGIPERRVLDREERLAVEDHSETLAGQFDAQDMPLVGRDRNVDAVSTGTPDDVERASLAAQGLVSDDIAHRARRDLGWSSDFRLPDV